MSEKERAAREIAARLRQAGYTALLAGGCVRDLLLGREPKDFDVATNAPAERVQQIFRRTIPVGAQFGVVLVTDYGPPIEVATFRTDEAYLDGRRPSRVRFATPELDARRRDFTINGMFLDPETNRVIDFVGGQEDLARKVIRAIGDPAERIAEDRLRMLRAVRFAAVLGFDIEPATLQAIRANAATITDIAWERIGDEIVRMLTEGSRGAARRAFELLDATDLLVHLLPEVAAMKGVEQSPDYHPEGDVWTHTLLVIEQLDHAAPTLALGALLHDVAKPVTQARHDHRITFYGHCERGAEMAVAICQRLRRSRETWERVAFLVREHLRHIHAREMRPSTLKRFLAQEGIEELLELVRMDILASNGNLDTYEFCRAKLAELRSQGNLPPPLLKGRDLLAAGYAPGPQIGEILRSVRDLQLDGQLHTREEALAWVSEHYPPATS
ncbi:MAG: polynucleotide adenylyltransferase [Candidatus Binatia bacterium]|nr:MAG: polynucleotide adenylyltransferase [Candidatus Binatia bacterium]